MEDLYVKNTLNFNTSISPKELNRNIDNTIQRKIKDEMEGKCIEIGYVRPDSINIINRSPGKLLVSQFNGSVIYNIQYSADICNPLEGAKIKVKIININKMGALAVVDGIEAGESPLSVLIAKQHHIDNEHFEKLQSGDVINVKIIGKRFEFGDTQISVIGILEDLTDVEAPITENITYSQRSPYKWMTPFYRGDPFEFGGRKFPTVEHAFQAQKSDAEIYKDLFTIGSSNFIGNDPSKAKKLGTKTNIESLNLTMREDWDDLQVDLMKNLMNTYFTANPDLKEKLKQTGNIPLIYKTVGDKFWGVNAKKQGENIHGQILEELRDSYFN